MSAWVAVTHAWTYTTGGLRATSYSHDFSHSCDPSGGDRESEGMPEAHAVELRRHEPCRTDSKREAYKEPNGHALKRLTQNHLRHPGPVCAERHPDADFVRLLRDHIGRDAVYANCSQQEGDNPEQSCEARNSPLSIE